MEENNADDLITEDIKEVEDTRPEYAKKRVIVPSITAVIFLICGIFYVIHSVYYKSTDDAFIEGHVITVAPRVAGPVLKLNIEDNQEVKKGDLLLEIDPKDYEAKLKETKAKLDEAKAQLVNTQNQVEKSYSDLDFAKADYERYRHFYTRVFNLCSRPESEFDGIRQADSRYRRRAYDSSVTIHIACSVSA